MFECENNYKLEVYHHPHYICQIVPKNINFFTINKYRNHLELRTGAANNKRSGYKTFQIHIWITNSMTEIWMTKEQNSIDTILPPSLYISFSVFMPKNQEELYCCKKVRLNQNFFATFLFWWLIKIFALVLKEWAILRMTFNFYSWHHSN